MPIEFSTNDEVETRVIFLNAQLVNNSRKSIVVPTHALCGWFGENGTLAVLHVAMATDFDIVNAKAVVLVIAAVKWAAISNKENAAQILSVQDMNIG